MGAWIEIICQWCQQRYLRFVAPLVGAWIEISWQYFAVIRSAGVAPLVGAWIEIFPIAFSQSLINVAPLVGAWIEIVVGYGDRTVLTCRSPRGSVD